MTNEELVAELRNLHRAYVGTGNGTSHHAKVILQAANTIDELSRTDKVGTWLELDSCVWYCSECGGFGCGSEYCPTCGTKMTGFAYGGE